MRFEQILFIYFNCAVLLQNTVCSVRVDIFKQMYVFRQIFFISAGSVFFKCFETKKRFIRQYFKQCSGSVNNFYASGSSDPRDAN
jgi:hypothetical protein